MAARVASWLIVAWLSVLAGLAAIMMGLVLSGAP